MLVDLRQAALKNGADAVLIQCPGKAQPRGHATAEHAAQVRLMVGIVKESLFSFRRQGNVVLFQRPPDLLHAVIRKRPERELIENTVEAGKIAGVFFQHTERLAGDQDAMGAVRRFGINGAQQLIAGDIIAEHPLRTVKLVNNEQDRPVCVLHFRKQVIQRTAAAQEPSGIIRFQCLDLVQIFLKELVPQISMAHGTAEFPKQCCPEIKSALHFSHTELHADLLLRCGVQLQRPGNKRAFSDAGRTHKAQHCMA